LAQVREGSRQELKLLSKPRPVPYLHVDASLFIEELQFPRHPQITDKVYGRAQ